MAWLILFFFLLMPTAAFADSQDSAKTGAAVKGDVLYWEGDELVVKEMSGREVRLHVNSETKIEGTAGRLKTGDKIEAAVNAEGNALSIRLQIPDGPAGSTVPGFR